jgi:hypothetical protein
MLRHDIEADRPGEAHRLGKTRFGIATRTTTIAPFGLEMQNDGREAALLAARRRFLPGGTQALSRTAGSTS